MRTTRLFLLLICFCVSSLHSQETKTFLLSKAEFKKFETENTLVSESIKNAFGKPDKENSYKLDIKQVDAWNSEVPEFKYFPAGVSSQRPALNSNIINSKTNVEINLRITINPGSSLISEALKPFINKKHTFNLHLAVLGDERILVKETRNKADFLSLIDDRAFADKAFRTFFGDPKKMNYSIAYDKLTACFIKNILEPKCNEKMELLASPENVYVDFNNKITSAEYTSAYIVFDLLVARGRSKFNDDVEKFLFKRKDSSEHLKFYFVIPNDNLRAEEKKIMDITGKILNSAKNPVKGLTINIRDNTNKIIATQKTNESGGFKFEKLKEGSNYSFFIDAAATNEKTLFISTNNDKIITQFEKTTSGFEYKILDADLFTLSDLKESDPLMEFTSSIKGRMVKVTDKIMPLVKQIVELKNNANQVIQTQETDNQGNFEFLALKRNENYSIEMPKYTAEKNEKVYIANSKNELIKQFTKNENNKFSFKIIPAEIFQLASMNEVDVELTFNKQKKLNKNEIIIQDFVYYSTNSFQVSPESKSTLDKIAKIVGENALYNLEIVSHTDSRGEDAENQKLSEKRSESVMNYLVTKNIDPKRLKTLGMGESKPLNVCTEGMPCIEDEYKMNRRTEFKFYK